MNYGKGLDTALQDPFILGGSRLLLKEKTYSGKFLNTRKGVTIKPIDKSASIDGSLTVNGDVMIFQDLDICFTGWKTRQSTDANGAGIPLEKKIDIYATNCKFINCNIHDMAGVGFWTASTASEFYGNNVYGIGWLGTDRGHGHAIYTQNQAGTKKTIKYNFFHNCFGWGIHAYSPTGTNLQDFDIIENISFNAGSLSGTPRPNILVGPDSGKASNILLDGNCTFGGASGISFYGQGGAENVTMRNNYCPDGIAGPYTAIEEANNYTGPAVGNVVKVFQNEHDLNRLHVAIYNQAKADTVSVDVSAYFVDGTSVTIINVQDYYIDRIAGIVQNGNIVVSMTNHTVFTPYQWQAPASTFPTFGAFVVQA